MQKRMSKLQKKNSEQISHYREIFPTGEFAIRESKIDDEYKIMIVNTALKDYEYKHLFPWSLWVNVIIEEPGLPTDKKAVSLNDFEDSIIGVLNKNADFLFIGRITHSGNRDIYFYLDNPKLVHEQLQKMTSNSQCEFEYVIDNDKSWKQVDIFYNY